MLLVVLLNLCSARVAHGVMVLFCFVVLVLPARYVVTLAAVGLNFSSERKTKRQNSCMSDVAGVNTDTHNQ